MPKIIQVKKGSTIEARIDDAFHALFGTTSKKKRGRKELVSDKEALDIVAREYFSDLYSHSIKKRSVAALVKQAAKETKILDKLNDSQLDSLTRLVRRKLKDQPLVKVSNQESREAHLQKVGIEKVLDGLKTLKIIK